MSKVTKETTVKEADKNAADAKNASDAREAIVKEAMKLHDKKEHSIQQMLAYCRQLAKYSKK